MARTFLDDNMLEWEAFASAGDFGYADRAHIVFNCLSDLSQRPRIVERSGDRADAEREVGVMPEVQLKELLRSARVNA
jgi:hypothetical protein